MKRLFTLFAAMLLAVCVWAQDCPKKISYQAVVRNSANQLVTNATGITVKVEILEGDAVKYSETHTGVTSNQNGLISLMIGENGTSVTGDMNNITNWPNDTIRTTITLPDGGGVVSAKSPVSAVPYALYACDINPDGPALKEIYTYINDTLNAYYDTTKINDTLKSYLTIDGLCDSIKNKCGDFATKTDVQKAVDTLVSQSTLNNYYTKSETYSQSEINTEFEKYYTKTKINDTLKSYLTIDGLCDSIKSKCTDIATITTVQTAIHDSIVYKISKQISDSLKHINIPDVSDMLTCENIASCDKIALVGSANTFTGKNTFTDTIDAKDGAVLVTSVVANDGTIEANDSLRAVNAKDLASYVDNAVAAKQVTLTIFSITAEDSTKLMNDTTLTIPAGFDTLDLSHLVQFYINGVYVGDTDDQVLTVNATTKKVHYDPAKNGGYALKAGDRIKIIYWVKKN